MVFTGEGKGKTSAALGVALRSLGRGGRCRIIQFIKGDRPTGESMFAEKMAPALEIIRVGRGFTWLPDTPRKEHERAAREGLLLAERTLASGEYTVVVLDEILYAVGAKLVTVEQVERLMDMRPESTHLILTGRGATDRIVEKADMVTRMEAVKHPMSKGVPAQPHLDY